LTTPAEPVHVLAHSSVLEPVGGVEVCTLQDSLALVGRGHRVELMYGADGSLRTAYEDAGVALSGPHHFAFDPRRPLRHAGGLASSVRRARSRSADVLWLNRIEHLPWGQAVTRSARTSLVCHLHGPPVFQRMELLGRGVAHFVAVSDFIRRAYVDRGVDPDRITRVYNALPPGAYPVGGLSARAAARQRFGLPADARIVLCYGQMSEAKGVLTLLQAFRRVSEVDPGALLVLVDSNSQRPHAVVQAELHRSDPRSVRVFPIADDVVPFLHAADVVAFPTWLPESFGRVVIEGMATGRPVVASRVGAVPELLTGSMERLLVEPRSATELAAALLDVLDWRDREPGLGAACAAEVDRRFPAAAHVDQLESVLTAAARARR
jgi:glycosyltransferase involved in cell wall biosynthesis